MIKTRWKPAQELEHSLRNFSRISIFSCGFCASLCDTGGTVGLKAMESFLRQRGKRVVLGSVVASCCTEEVMRQSMKRHRNSILKSEALLILSCSAGIKSAYLVGVDVPVIGALDTIGNTPITRQKGTVAETTCSTCGQCVLNYTGGICPLAGCPLHLKYGPCDRFTESDDLCAVDKSGHCIWKGITQIGNMEDLARIRNLHKNEIKSVATLMGWRPWPWVRRVSGWVMAHSGWLEKAALSIR